MTHELPTISRPRCATLLLACTAIYAALALPAPVWAESLEQAMSSAYAVNPGLKAERSRYEAINQGIWTARSNFLPTITGNYVGEHSAFRSDRDNDSDRAFFHELGVTLSQPLFQGFSAVNRLNQAHEEAVSGRNQLIGTEQTLLFNTADAYLRVVRDRCVLAHLKKYVGVVQREVRGARARYESGDGTRTDIEQALARLAEAQGNRDQAVGDLEASVALYERLTGQEPGKIGWPAVPGSLKPNGLEDGINIAYQNNPQIRAATADARAARYAARASVGDMLPRVDLESSWSNGYRGNLGNRDEEDFRLGVRVTAPFFTGGRNIAAVRTAKFTAAQQEFELDDIQQIIRENVTRAYKQEAASRLRAAASKRAIGANRRAVKGLQVEFESGQRSLLDVLDGERELLTSQVDYERARYDAMIAEFFLLASIGRLAPSNFSIIEELPPAVPRLVPEFNNWTLRLEPSETELAEAQFAIAEPLPPDTVIQAQTLEPIR
ncbi:type I secretion protein TolC [Roseibium hamelinense]|nr:TolC family outer membrane protein [Roseibium hamelinense]MTI44902.1 type I secretion protein TolC [Roseibium hamelinense]